METSSGFDGRYLGTAVDIEDPIGEGRVQVVVPDLALEATWAQPGEAMAATPAVGDPVVVTFEHGDLERPIWEPVPPEFEPVHADLDYGGRYLGRVVDDVDPGGEHRLLVLVPDTGPEPFWATAGTVEVDPTPAIDSDVWIEFEDGDVTRPRWVGRAHA